MAISTCAPFFKEGYSNKNIYGTSCIDINPQGDLNEYFNLEAANKDKNFFMLMNDDRILSSDNILQQKFGYKKRLSDSSMNQVIQSAMDFITWKKTITNPGEEFQSDQIDSLLLEKGNARLYGDQTLNYGELVALDEFGEKKQFFFVLASLDAFMYDRKIRTGEFTSLEQALGTKSDDIRNYKIAFFSESSEFLKTIKETRATLVNEIF